MRIKKNSQKKFASHFKLGNEKLNTIGKWKKNPQIWRHFNVCVAKAERASERETRHIREHTNMYCNVFEMCNIYHRENNHHIHTDTRVEQRARSVRSILFYLTLFACQLNCDSTTFVTCVHWPFLFISMYSTQACQYTHSAAPNNKRIT